MDPELSRFQVRYWVNCSNEGRGGGKKDKRSPARTTARLRRNEMPHDPVRSVYEALGGDRSDGRWSSTRRMGVRALGRAQPGMKSRAILFLAFPARGREMRIESQDNVKRANRASCLQAMEEKTKLETMTIHGLSSSGPGHWANGRHASTLATVWSADRMWRCVQILFLDRVLPDR